MAHIITVPAFSDNYIWLVCNKKPDENESSAVIVDPGDPGQLMLILEEQAIKPVAVLITHFHFDHANGIPTLLERYPGLPVYGPLSEQEILKQNPIPAEYGPASHCFKTISEISNPLLGGELLPFDEIACRFKVLNIPGHTSGHIAYYDQQNGNLFCGDTLFACGCGRVFDGTLQDLHNSLQKIAKLPEKTKIYCAHEYTLDNIGFAKWVEPKNPDLLAREQAAMQLIDNDQATVPSSLALELQTNPFLRTDQPHVIKRVEQATGKKLNNPAEVFAAMRIWKDTEYD